MQDKTKNSSSNMLLSKMHSSANQVKTNENQPKACFNNTITSNLNANSHAATTNASIKYGHTNQSMANIFSKSINLSSLESKKTLDQIGKSYSNSGNDAHRLMTPARSKNEKFSNNSKSTDYIHDLSKTDKYLKKLLHNKSMNLKTSGKILKRSNADKSKKTNNLSIMKVSLIIIY
jgi:hypothetical protein